ncbi:stAR-related lipid transfer protein 7, mitochondrial-like isoform X2 [Varroa jacobsoni]|uniref:Phosphatidylcholine transfer protein n=1 Tax=Varroa destructor TaxID=109461 RepID=A0A7M7KQY3_VARDE|nr:stAR-related lipid transfer protein 7, mitochondrial-like isoform X2 [Varroa destructor]XP_022701654.1 stAR-related lipid transfer protein 7, mitochondrial-like isoform X2 [Varroa jacobsoni]
MDINIAISAEGIIIRGGLFTRQANIYVHNRVRKALQLHAVYRSAFGQQFFRAFVHNLLRTAIRKRTPMFLLGAAGFSFQDEGISDDEIASCIDEFEILKKRPPSTPCCTHSAKCDRRTGHALKLNMEKFRTHLRSEGFEPVVESDRLHIWRKSETGKANYTYKVYGTFTDVPARAFFAVQCDTDYRKKWDKLVVQLDVVESDSQNDVVYWHMYYPFPLSSRDYVFVRRSVVDTERACMVVVCHATQHPQCPPRKGVVRVNEYMSNMVISPHNSFDENGFDYLLTYYDDPQSSFPSPVYAWMAASGVHDYVDKLHKATQQFNDGSALRPTLSITKGTISSSASAISNNTSVHFQTTHQQAQAHYAWHRSAL